MGRVLSVLILVGCLAGPVSAASPSWRLLSRSSAGFKAVINGVPGHLDLAHFHCPATLHVATCGITLLMGDPIILNLIAHGSLKVMENVNWAEFYPDEWGPEAKALRKLVREPAHNSELYRIVDLHLRHNKDKVSDRHREKTVFRGGKIELTLGSHSEKQLVPQSSALHPTFREQTGRIWVTTPVVDIHRSQLLLQGSTTSQFYQVTYEEGSPWSLTEASPVCGELLLLDLD